MYYKRIIDKYLAEWAQDSTHKPVLLRGARQVGKSCAVKHLGDSFEQFVELNFEKEPQYIPLFQGDLDVKRICGMISAMKHQLIEPGKTLLFLDEIQLCPEAIMSLRFFKEDYPELHVVAAGSLLEFAIRELPTFGVGRIHSMFMYPMTFNEFLLANGYEGLAEARDSATAKQPLFAPLHGKLVNMFRSYLLVGGMPEAVAKWVETQDYMLCQQVQDQLLITYDDDFSKYAEKADPTLMRLTLRSVAIQMGKKFVYSHVSQDYRVEKIRKAVEMLTLAGLIVPITHTSANGLPLGSGAERSYRKMLFLDSGLLLRLLDMTFGNAAQMATQVLISTAEDLVNKGPLAEMVAGLEMIRYKSPNMRHELFYWVRQEKNSTAEVDYLQIKDMTVLPIEVKASTQGGMKSLWAFMRERHLHEAVRCSLENFGEFNYSDPLDNGEMRHVRIVPLYAMGKI